jgi:YD repeat-containing protein
VKQGTTTLRAFTYDAAGNPTRDARSGVNTDYGYDNAGRLRTVTVAASLKATYTYDAFDRLAIRTLTNQTPPGTTHFIHMLGGGGALDDLAPGLGEQLGGLGNRIIGETNGARVLTREYAWIDDRIVAVLSDANAASPLLWWVTNDHLGRPVQMTDSAQAVVWRAAYRPFGEVISVTGPASLDARFPGRWFQLENGHLDAGTPFGDGGIADADGSRPERGRRPCGRRRFELLHLH